MSGWLLNRLTKVLCLQCAADMLKWEHRLEKKSDGTDQKPRVLGNGLHVAEVCLTSPNHHRNKSNTSKWLHLAAFSWGGLLALPTSENDDQHETSDVPSNLVLGTSETNSQMTRFEKPWQDLVRDETLLTGKDGFSGTLMIVRNPLGDKAKAKTRRARSRLTRRTPLISTGGCHLARSLLQARTSSAWPPTCHFWPTESCMRSSSQASAGSWP